MTIQQLVRNYENQREDIRRGSINESQLRNDFLNPFFEILGWDLINQRGLSTYNREVIVEENLQDEDDDEISTRRPDYSFRLFTERKFFVEAKKASIDITTASGPAKQIRRYGFTGRLKISVLCNFEHLIIYDCSDKVEEEDAPNKGRIKVYHYTEYEEKLPELLRLIGRESIYNGDFDIEWREIEDKISHYSIDNLFLEEINNFRLWLGGEIYRHSPTIEKSRLNDLVQSYLNIIMFLRVCEDRNIEEYKTLLHFVSADDFGALLNKFQQADWKYNSGLFVQDFADAIIQNSQSAFWEIIKHLYQPYSQYSFAVFSSDILGSIYEIFISEQLEVQGGNIVLVRKPENVDRDIVTTPIHIIRDILKKTVVPYCNGKTDEQILNSKFADIACGSGAFLLELYELLNNILYDYYSVHNRSNLIQIGNTQFKLRFEIKKQILTRCIFGVDKDYNAIEATKFGLLLKLLEYENNHSLPETSILPNLSNNIYFGNSLINPVQAGEYFEIINPHNFTNSFDIIIGNPPYMKSEDMKKFTGEELPLYNRFYESAHGQYDKYFLFIEKGLNLLNPDGYLGFIVPNKFTKVSAGEKLRRLLRESRNLSALISFGANQIFADKSNYTCLLILNKSNHDSFRYHEVANLTDWQTRQEEAIFEDIDLDNLDDEVWTLIPANFKPIFERISEQSTKLEDIIGAENIFGGIQTSATKIYVIEADREDEDYVYFTQSGTEWRIELECTRPYYKTLRGGTDPNLNTYRLVEPNRYIIYPYRRTVDGIELIPLTELRRQFPFTYRYLYSHRTTLARRDMDRVDNHEDKWYRYGRNQNIAKCDVDQKIIVGVLSKGNKYAIDNRRTVFSAGGTAGYWGITIPEDCQYSIHYIQAILNSKYAEWFAILTGEVYRGGYISHGDKVLNRLPIRGINFENPSERAIHDNIVRIQSELISLQNRIDSNRGDTRRRSLLETRFTLLKSELDNALVNLYNLGADDQRIPLIEDIYI